jgi:dihydrofolate reductase
MDLRIIAAMSENGIIGLEGNLPWHIPEDLKRFKELTLEKNVVMGKRTYESLKGPLPNRENIVLSNNLEYVEKGVILKRNFCEIMNYIKEKPTYIIGGEKIYKLFLPFVNNMEITKVHGYFKGDTKFPEVDWKDFEGIEETKGKTKDNLEYSFWNYKRINNFIRT